MSSLLVNDFIILYFEYSYLWIIWVDDLNCRTSQRINLFTLKCPLSWQSARYTDWLYKISVGIRWWPCSTGYTIKSYRSNHTCAYMEMYGTGQTQEWNVIWIVFCVIDISLCLDFFGWDIYFSYIRDVYCWYCPTLSLTRSYKGSYCSAYNLCGRTIRIKKPLSLICYYKRWYLWAPW